MVNFVGIDLGTTNSIVSYLNQEEKVEVLEIEKSKIVPSVIFFEGEKILIGNKALEKANVYPESAIRLFKRKIGTKEEFKVKKLLKKKKKSKKYIVVDTNIFINNLDFEEKLKEDEIIIIPYTVCDEIKFRSKDLNTIIQAKKALDKIEFLQKEGLLIFKEADVNLIPKGGFKSDKKINDCNDNLIFSVVRKEQLNNEDVFLLTGDRGLRAKATEFGIINMSPEEFNNNRKDVKRELLKSYTAEEASALFLTILREKINKLLESDIENAVITVPANFSTLQIEATRRAAKKAGFIEIRMLKEPIAAAITYGVDTASDENIAVYDFGGGTFDFSIIRSNKQKSIEVIAVDGNPSLGGEDFTDGLIENIIFVEIEEKYNLNMESLQESGLREEYYKENKKNIRKRAETIKKLISESSSETLSLEGLWINNEEKKDFDFEITRENFENEVAIDIGREAINVMNRALEEGNIKVDEIDKIILAGGTSLIPRLQKAVENFFGKKPVASKDLATIVSKGATIMGSRYFTKVEKDLDEGDFGITEFLNKSIGLKVEGEEFRTMLNYKSTIPCSFSKNFMPAKNFQDSINIKVYEKDKYSKAILVTDEGIKYLDNIKIKGLAKFKQEDIIVNVNFLINRDNLLSVKATIIDNNGNQISNGELEIKRDNS